VGKPKNLFFIMKKQWNKGTGSFEPEITENPLCFCYFILKLANP
jgi:hypothetical protein